MKSKHCDRPTCDKLCAPSYDALTVVGVVNKLDRQQRERDRLAVAKFSKCRVSDKVLEGNTVTVGETGISLQHSV